MIKIEDLIPFLKKGWVAMDSSNIWFWTDKKPWTNTQDKKENRGYWYANTINAYTLEAFDIAPAEDWTQSLIKIERKDK